MRGVRELMGSVPCSPGKCANKLQNRAKSAPQRIDEGRRSLWLAVRMAKRAACGTAIPMKLIGPQREVTTAVSQPVITKSRVLTDFTPMPRFAA